MKGIGAAMSQFSYIVLNNIFNIYNIMYEEISERNRSSFVTVLLLFWASAQNSIVLSLKWIYLRSFRATRCV